MAGISVPASFLGMVDGQTFGLELRFRISEVFLLDHGLHALLEIGHRQSRARQAIQEGEHVVLRDPAVYRRGQDLVPRAFPLLPDGAVLIQFRDDLEGQFGQGPLLSHVAQGGAAHIFGQ